eukprot:CAMPEP_0168557208 /NCGR_PEP_ID=MMETSP0413-20121227/9301_1 /TAXON_ID=136452 /ORGANISM="Filamoeba nolandi, Strain NC-AS-23-1" /LENGTH=668 /DNA_ID=CAMNT_0008588221 /DNA_START=5 /DNA_END=2010 /DNA_ORIENTATION=+
MAAIPIDPMDKIDKFVDKFIEFEDDEESIFGELKLKKETLSEFSHLISPHTIAEEIRNAPKTIQNKTKQGSRWLVNFFESMTYIKGHIMYFLFFCVFGGIVLYLIELSNEQQTVTFVDALFTAVSAVCVTGLSSVDFSKFTLAGQIATMILIQLGSSVMMTLSTVIIRRYYLRKRFLIGYEEEHGTTSNGKADPPTPIALVNTSNNAGKLIQLDNMNETESNAEEILKKTVEGAPEEASEIDLRKLLDEEEYKIKKLEYEALGRLTWVVAGYILVPYMLCFFSLSLYLTFSDAREILRENGDINPVWFAAFHIVSAFNNAGFSLFPVNLVPLYQDRFVLMVLSILIALGNTAFPLILRFVIWICRRLATNFAPFKILLVRPRSLFTHLFPATETRLLLSTWIVMTGAQFFLFLVLNWDNSAFKHMDNSVFMLNAWFTTVCTRTAGFNTIDLNAIQKGLLVMYVVMMYVSSYPFTYTLHESAPIAVDQSVYQDELDIEASRVKRDAMTGLRVEEGSKGQKYASTKSMFKAMKWHTQSLFYQHIVWLFFAWFLIVCLESDRMEEKNSGFEIFKVIFEIASAYGTVGLSLGYIGSVTSYSGVLTPVSKFLMMSVMFLGRHRGLPSSLDPAIQLYQEKMLYKGGLNTKTNKPAPPTPVTAHREVTANQDKVL